MSIALGGAFMDFWYFFVILSGLSLFNFNPHFSLSLKILGISFLFAIGIKDLLTNDASTQKVISNKQRVHNYFLLGILIYVSNPTLVFSLSTLCTFIKSFDFFPSNFLNNGIFSLSIAVGSSLWFYTLLVLVKKFENRINQSFMLKINRVSGGLIILFSFYLFYKTFLYS
jgi:arginine exporter protein ArgO